MLVSSVTSPSQRLPRLFWFMVSLVIQECFHSAPGPKETLRSSIYYVVGCKQLSTYFCPNKLVVIWENNTHKLEKKNNMFYFIPKKPRSLTSGTGVYDMHGFSNLESNWIPPVSSSIPCWVLHVTFFLAQQLPETSFWKDMALSKVQSNVKAVNELLWVGCLWHTWQMSNLAVLFLQT